jgi:uncharacterized protein YbjT (DUF2867 family)
MPFGFSYWQPIVDVALSRLDGVPLAVFGSVRPREGIPADLVRLCEGPGDPAGAAGAAECPLTNSSDARGPSLPAQNVAQASTLTDERHANRLYEVTGPRALTFAEAVAEIAAGLGRPIRYVQMTPDDFVISLRPYVPEDIVQLLHELFTVVLDGRNTQVMHGVEEALGRPPRDFSEFVRNTVAAGIWNGPQ